MSDTQTKELAKSYEPASIEAKWYPYWEEHGYFAAGKDIGKPSSPSSFLRRTLPVFFIWAMPSTRR